MHESGSKFLRLLKENINWIVTVTGLFAFLYPIINYIYNFNYQSECEQVYSIPR